MTVKELLEKLNGVPQDYIVCMIDNADNTYTVDSAEVDNYSETFWLNI